MESPAASQQAKGIGQGLRPLLPVAGRRVVGVHYGNASIASGVTMVLSGSTGPSFAGVISGAGTLAPTGEKRLP